MIRRRHAVIAAGGAVLLALAIVIADAALPPDLTRYHDLSPLVLDRRGEVLRAFRARDDKLRLPISVNEVDPGYIDMLVSYEDKRFFQHPGVDPIALFRALGQAIANGRVVSGGSTITMQVARLLEPRPRTLTSKLLEIARALQLEVRYSKLDILQIYLTLTPFGGNLEGVRAASLAWFGKNPRYLTDGEAALLVALPQSPTRRRPDLHPAAARQARKAVIDRVGRALGWTGQRMNEARGERGPGSRLAMPFEAPHLAERVLALSEHRIGAVRTTIDRGIQRLVTGLVGEQAARLGPRVNGAAMVMDRASGELVAYVGSADYWGRERHGAVNFAAAVRSSGSTLKPFIYGAAMDALLVQPWTLVSDTAFSHAGYSPSNFDGRYRGDVTVADALRLSLNVTAVRTLQQLGVAPFLELLREAGSPIGEHRSNMRTGLTAAVGGLSVSLEQLVHLYTALGNGGTTRPLRLSPRVGLFGAGRLFDPASAEKVRDILAGTYSPFTAASKPYIASIKTGTSYGYRDAWALGVSEKHVIGVWFGRPDGKPMAKHTGATAAVPIVRRTLRSIEPATVFARPPAFDFFPASPAVSRLARTPTRCDRIIDFPEDGSRIPMRSLKQGVLPLRSKPGIGRTTWFANAVPLAKADRRGHGKWRVDGPGFVEIALVSAHCGTARAEVRID